MVYPMEWDNSAELQELKEHFPKRFQVFLAFVAILSNNNGVREGWAAYNTLASQAGCTRRTAMTTVKWLMEHGMLLRRYRWEANGDPAPNFYRLLDPPSLQKAPVRLNRKAWEKPENLPPRWEM